jgi:hypothetical protein
MAQPLFAAERRVSGVADRRHLFGRGGRRVGDYRAPEMSAIVPCSACGIAWASIYTFIDEQGEATATYICPRCGHHERRVTGNRVISESTTVGVPVHSGTATSAETT